MTRARIAAAAACACVAIAPPARADADVVDRRPPITLPWLATQLVPSPEIAFGREVAPGLRWQVTPVLYSFGVYHRLSPWRFFVAEPIVRQSGSIELFVSPEYLAFGTRATERWIGRVGARVYGPVIERGEYLSVSIGASAYAHDGQVGPTIEAGVYALYGIVGLQASYSPLLYGGEGIGTLCVRYF